MMRAATTFGVAAVVLLATACSERPLGPGSGDGELQIHAAVNSPTVATLVVEVTAADLTDPLIFNFELIEGVASGTLVVPAGARRTITVRAYDTEGIQTHEGQVLVNIRPGPNPAVPITLRPRTGEQPIEIVLGSFTVKVDPAEATVVVGQALQLNATVTDADGTVVGGTADVVWATDAPAVATVDAAGLVTAHLEGSARIVASFGGVAAAARVAVGVVPAGSLVINEVDYDQPGFDAGEFVEVYNGTGGAIDLSGLAVILINGATNAEYFRVSLDGLTLAAGGYLVLANVGVTVPVGALRIEIPDNIVQNGAPDGVVLFNTVSNTVVDALSYEGSITAATITGAPGTYTLVEGTATSAQDSDLLAGSLIRNPNGGDTGDAAADWAVTSTPTPGAANAP